MVVIVLDPAARRLLVASTVRLHVAEVLGRDPVGPDDAPALARRLAAADPDRLTGRGVECDPPYPGATTGPEPVRDGTRMVLLCRARYGGEPVAVIVTTLLPGRSPEITAAPPATPLPGGATPSGR